MLASYNDPNLFLEAFHFSADDSQAFPGTMTYPKRGPSSTPCFQQYHSLSHSRNPSTASSNYSYPSDTHSAASSPYMSSYTSTHYLQPPSMQQEHLPTPTHTPTSQDFAINDTPRSNGQYQDSKPTSTPGGNAYGRYPRSNASNQSVQASDLPVTPQTVNSDDFEHYQPSFAIVANDQQNVGWGQQTAFPSASTFHSVPKLDRTISDIYADELYQPIQPQQQQPQIQQQQFNQSYLNPPQQLQSQVMQKALRLADQARSQSPNSEKSRDFSPFRQSSPYALNTASYQPHIQTAASTRQQQRQMAAGQAMSQYRAKREESHPTTISPKDALLDYHEPDESSPSLFPEASSQQSNMSDAQSGHQNNQTQFQPPSSDFQFATPGMPVSAQNDSKFQPPHFGTQGSSGSLPSGLDFPAHMATMESSRSESADEDEDDEDDDEDQEEDSQDNYEEFVAVQRPAQTNADTGTYTCTYHGCRERFTSPMLLQKHKREDHRSTAPGTHHSSSPAIGQTNQQTQMTQAGPHRCDRINPQTGKPCNSVFSRPYDLTRHEDTIHNRAKAKVRCHLCTEEKTFSRNDALTRHMKVVHPDVPWPSKHKRRR